MLLPVDWLLEYQIRPWGNLDILHSLELCLLKRFGLGLLSLDHIGLEMHSLGH